MQRLDSLTYTCALPGISVHSTASFFRACKFAFGRQAARGKLLQLASDLFKLRNQINRKPSSRLDLRRKGL